MRALALAPVAKGLNNELLASGQGIRRNEQRLSRNSQQIVHKQPLGKSGAVVYIAGQLHMEPCIDCMPAYSSKKNPRHMP